MSRVEREEPTPAVDARQVPRVGGWGTQKYSECFVCEKKKQKAAAAEAAAAEKERRKKAAEKERRKKAAAAEAAAAEAAAAEVAAAKKEDCRRQGRCRREKSNWKQVHCDTAQAHCPRVTILNPITDNSKDTNM